MASKLDIDDRVTVMVGTLPNFYLNLNDKARALFLNPETRADLPGYNLINFVKSVHWPVKEWYECTMADIANELVENGVIYRALMVTAVKLASGKVYVDALALRDCGPDLYGNIIMCFFSTKTREELNAMYNTSAFRRDGEADCSSTWFDFARTIPLR